MKTNREVIKQKSWWHTRKYYKSGHAALIVGEIFINNEEYFLFLNITTNPPVGYAYYETKRPISINKNNKSYIRLYLQKGKKKHFSKWLMKYEFTYKDYEEVEKFLTKKARTALWPKC